MRNKVSRILFLFVCSCSLCFSTPTGVRVGLKAGINHCALDGLTGTGFHIGVDVGYYVHPNFAIGFAPQIKTANYYTPWWPSTDYEYTNLYIPLVFSINPLPEKSVAPYLGIGPAVNVQLRGRAIPDWVVHEDIEELETDFYLIYVLGIDAKLAQFRIRPEFFFNQNMTANFPDVPEYTASIYDFGLAIGVSYKL